MRILMMILLLALAGCNDHKRAYSFDGKPSEKKAPYNGVPAEEQKK